jgi:hypothetical protein
MHYIYIYIYITKNLPPAYIFTLKLKKSNSSIKRNGQKIWTDFFLHKHEYTQPIISTGKYVQDPQSSEKQKPHKMLLYTPSNAKNKKTENIGDDMKKLELS